MNDPITKRRNTLPAEPLAGEQMTYPSPHACMSLTTTLRHLRAGILMDFGGTVRGDRA